MSTSSPDREFIGASSPSKAPAIRNRRSGQGDRASRKTDAKARFSELLRATAEKGPQVITYRGEPAYEIRRINSTQKRHKTFLEVLQSCPKVPEFELPKRKYEPPRKVFDEE